MFHEFVYEPSLSGFADRANRLKIGDGLKDGVQLGAMIAPRCLEAMDALGYSAAIRWPASRRESA